MQVAEAFILDANGNPVSYNGHLVTKKSLAYTGAAHLGAQDATTLFTVTGDVIVAIFAVCTEDLAGASATLEVGIAGNTAALIAQTVGTTIDLGEIWTGTNPPTVASMPADKILTNGTDIIQTIATANVTDGELTYYCLWVPLTAGASVVAA
ncbi:hypothetical protein UNPF46_08580 [Bradyrhizobium sp. UNPF46]|uniref:hypothetical protein n=1 Tax=Bradyrhizobium sp. UNPF46 TaxID=1141168 RepID=UPI00114D58D3|nr:hypothetical protein [Bradyrhizobium sp. UNPF46]TQF41166.1 hypothetical protein UNPF46_08580 [Bradyrhizobium sp. UNPF46]